MLTMHPTLLVGPADWDPPRMPKDGFLDRIAALWRACDPAIAGAIVYGDARHHAELAYLTHFTPKLEPAIALIPRTGAPRLLVGGGVNMLAAAKPLTWIDGLLPLREAGATIARWQAELDPGRLAQINGDSMPFGMRQNIVNALGAVPPDLTRTLVGAMRHKSPPEMAQMRQACATLAAAVAAMGDAQRAGKCMTDVVLAGELLAHRRGAQDVRSLFGRGETLAPFRVPVPETADPLQVYVAVRHGGYWAEGFAVLSRSVQPAAAAASAILEAAVRLLKPSVAHRDVAHLVGRSVGTRRLHPVTRGDFGCSIGLALQEAGGLNEGSNECFAAGETYTLRVGLTEGANSAIVSAMVAITERGHEVLWAGDPR
jgi:Xaa-Pro aminopeptidase